MHQTDCIDRSARDLPYLRTAGNSLRQAPEVVEALSSAWTTVCETVGTSDGLCYQMYTVMCRKLYLSSKLEEGDAHIDVQECMENMKEDWKEDTDGRPVLSEAQFVKSWFQVRAG
jgi:hypothetical protein